MSAYEIAVQNGKTVCRELRLKMGYSIGDMAQILGISKATYQGYDQGTRTPPQEVIKAMDGALERDRNFFARYAAGGAFDQEIDRLYPRGISCV
jgi:transcriptional regulator with XRE-family HTH domain